MKNRRRSKMNFMKNSTLITIVFCGLNMFAQTFNPSDIEFTISLEKDTFFVDEPLYLELKETNITEQKVYISNGPFDQIFTTELFSENGVEYKWFIGIVKDYFGYDAISFLELHPGESQYCSVDLLDGFGSFVEYKGKRAKTLPVGTYKITVTHKAMESWKEDFGKTYSEKIIPVMSNTFTFTVINPEGYDEEERQAYCAGLRQFYRERKSQSINTYLNSYFDSPNYYKYDILQCSIRYKLNKAYSEQYQFDLSLEQMVNEIANSNASFITTGSLRRYLDDSNKNQKVDDIEQYNRIKEKLTSDKFDSKLSIYYKMEIEKEKNKKIY